MTASEDGPRLSCGATSKGSSGCASPVLTAAYIGEVFTPVVHARDRCLEDSANLPPPGVIAAEIVEDLRTALEQFEAIENDLAGLR